MADARETVTDSQDAFMLAWNLIEKFGDAVTDMFEQMERGNWVDDHGHNVKNNKQMIALIPLIQEAIAIRERGEREKWKWIVKKMRTNPMATEARP